jgi:microcystin-dependent protein
VTDSDGTTRTIAQSLYTVDVTNKRIKYPKTGAAIASGNTITVARVSALTQAISLRTQSFDPRTMEKGLDKLTMIVQEQSETLSRALVTDITTTGANFSMAAPVANKVIGWDSAGENMINYDNPAVAEAAAATSAAEAAEYAEQAANSAIEAGTVVDYEGETEPSVYVALFKWHKPSVHTIYMRDYTNTSWIYLIDTATTSPPVGSVIEFYGTELPSRYLWVNGLTIGDTSSSATALASADAIDLYTVLWNSANITGSQIWLYTSAGVLTTKGADAATDFAVHKRLSLPDKRGRTGIGLDNMGGTSADVVTNSNADVLGGKDGEENHTLTINKMPSHNHNVWGAGINAGNGVNIGGVNASNVYLTGVLNTGGGESHNNMQPWVACNYIMRY